jgi:Domain of unknown function (DUF4349)
MCNYFFSIKNQAEAFMKLFRISYTVLFVFLISIICISCGRSAGGQVKGEASYDGISPASSRPGKNRAPITMDKKYGAAEAVESEADEPENQNEDPSIIIYKADCSVAVTNVRDSILSLEKMAKDTGGNLESIVSSDSFTTAKVTMRVPSAKFEAVLADLSKLGYVESKEVTASNVTEQYNDLQTRMKTAEKVRQRLNELLQRAKSATDKIAILKQIDRLTAKIESMKARLDYLKDQSDFSTIHVSLRVERRASVKQYMASPFSWIRGLFPERRSITKNAQYEVDNPGGYYFLKQSYDSGGRYLFALPGDVSGVRIGETENYPNMDAAFWREAFETDTVRRMYKKTGSSILKSAKGEFAVYHFSVSAGKYYTAAFLISGESIVVIEADYDSEKTFKEQSKNIETMISSYGGKK